MQKLLGEVAGSLRVSVESILMFLIAPDVVCQRAQFDGDLFGVGSCLDELLCLFEVLWAPTENAAAVFFADVGALLIDAVGVDDFEKTSDQFADGNLVGVKDSPYTFGIAVVRT